jgi:lipoprotein signal peptidase
MKVLTISSILILCIIISFLLPFIGINYVKTVYPLGLTIPVWVNSVVAIALILYIFLHKWQTFGILFITGGILSNVIERSVQGYVKDYISGPFATYNLADIFILVGIILLIKNTYYGSNTNKSSSIYNNSSSKRGDS